jgi:hypothetical protein
MNFKSKATPSRLKDFFLTKSFCRENSETILKVSLKKTSRNANREIVFLIIPLDDTLKIILIIEKVINHFIKYFTMIGKVDFQWDIFFKNLFLLGI